MNLPILEQAAFIATKHAPTDSEWAELVQAFEDDCGTAPAREACFLYAESFIIEQRSDGFYPHAWWYAPVRYDSIERAEEVLFKWRSEFV